MTERWSRAPAAARLPVALQVQLPVALQVQLPVAPQVQLPVRRPLVSLPPVQLLPVLPPRGPLPKP